MNVGIEPAWSTAQESFVRAQRLADVDDHAGDDVLVTLGKVIVLGLISGHPVTIDAGRLVAVGRGLERSTARLRRGELRKARRVVERRGERSEDGLVRRSVPSVNLLCDVETRAIDFCGAFEGREGLVVERVVEPVPHQIFA